MASKHSGYLLPEAMEETLIEEALRAIDNDIAFNTKPSYSADVTAYPDHQISFIEKHLAYLKSHPKVSPKQYLANLRLMTRNRK